MPSTKQVQTGEVRMVDTALAETDNVIALKGAQECVAPHAKDDPALRTS